MVVAVKMVRVCARNTYVCIQQLFQRIPANPQTDEVHINCEAWAVEALTDLQDVERNHLNGMPLNKETSR